MEVKDIIKFPVRYCDEGDCFFDSENNLVADLRGWGRIGYIPNSDTIMLSIGRFIAEAINEKEDRRDSALKDFKNKIKFENDKERAEYYFQR